MINGDDSSNIESKSQDNEVKSTDSVEKAQDQVVKDSTATSEKMLKQSDVDKIVGSAKKEAADRVRREYEFKIQQAQMQQQSSYAPQQPSTASNFNQMPEDKIRQMINEEAQRQSQISEANRIASEFISKLETGKTKYPDFEEKVAQLNLPTIPQIVALANSMENTADVMYEIASHPAKFANIMVLAHSAPHLAAAEFKRLSDSIKKNEEAAKQQLPSEPLSQVKPSTTGTDNGSASVTALRKQSWLRG